MGLWMLLADAPVAQTNLPADQTGKPVEASPVVVGAKPAAAASIPSIPQAAAPGLPQAAPAAVTALGPGEAIVPRLRRVHPGKAAQEAKDKARLGKDAGGKAKTLPAKAKSRQVATQK